MNLHFKMHDRNARQPILRSFAWQNIWRQHGRPLCRCVEVSEYPVPKLTPMPKLD